MSSPKGNRGTRPRSSSSSSSTSFRRLRRLITIALAIASCIVMLIITSTFLLGSQADNTSVWNSLLASSPTYNRPSFRAAMRSFSWTEYEEALKGNNKNEINRYAEQLLYTLEPFLLLPPDHSPDPSCRPPPLMAGQDIDCTAYPKAFTGTKRKTPSKVAHIIQLGFDADLLEVLLHELDDVVDHFFIIESTKTHRQGMGKSLLYEDLKQQPRFQPFKDKTVHMILDDVESEVKDPSYNWAMENLQERARWESFKAWNRHHQDYFGPEDIIGFGDVDNIASRQNVQLLRHCHMQGPSVDIGSWMAWGQVEKAYKAHWNVPNHGWTYGDPTFWTLSSAMNLTTDDIPTRRRGKSGYYLLGGIHMSDHGYLPYLISKLLTCTEMNDKQFIQQQFPLIKASLENPTPTSIRKLEKALNRYTPTAEEKMLPVQDIASAQLKDVLYYPWFFECNPHMYPTWYGRHDTRLDG